jgi:hypothetical protein
MRLIHVVADYGSGDLAVAEVFAALTAEINRYQSLNSNLLLHFSGAPSFDTVTTGFLVAQLSRKDSNAFVYANCAPREDSAAARANNEGEGLLYAELKNGGQVVGVNSGYSLSFIRTNIQKIYSVKVSSGGSQFRSRDTFPKIVAAAFFRDLTFCDKELKAEEVIPLLPESVIGYIDSFGNIKTTLTSKTVQVANLAPGERVRITINGVGRMASVATGSFNVGEGDIAFAPGSSGDENRFWEIFQRGGSAWHTYGRPRAGAPISLTQV